MWFWNGGVIQSVEPSVVEPHPHPRTHPPTFLTGFLRGLATSASRMFRTPLRSTASGVLPPFHLPDRCVGFWFSCSIRFHQDGRQHTQASYHPSKTHRGEGKAEVPVAITTASASLSGASSESGSRESAAAYSISLLLSPNTSRSFPSERATARTLYFPSLARRALEGMWMRRRQTDRPWSMDGCNA